MTAVEPSSAAVPGIDDVYRQRLMSVLQADTREYRRVIAQGEISDGPWLAGTGNVPPYEGTGSNEGTYYAAIGPKGYLNTFQPQTAATPGYPELQEYWDEPTLWVPEGGLAHGGVITAEFYGYITLTGGPPAGKLITAWSANGDVRAFSQTFGSGNLAAATPGLAPEGMVYFVTPNSQVIGSTSATLGSKAAIRLRYTCECPDAYSQFWTEEILISAQGNYAGHQARTSVYALSPSTVLFDAPGGVAFNARDFSSGHTNYTFLFGLTGTQNGTENVLEMLGGRWKVETSVPH